MKKIIYFFINRKEYGRIKKFDDFNKEEIFFSKDFLSNYKNASYLKDRYDFFVCGSDQIWNSYHADNASNNFLQFAYKNQRISYAASFGTSDLKNDRIDEFKEWLNSIPSISVREEEGKKIINKLTKRSDIYVLIDPTMLLTSKEWLLLEKKPNKLNNIHKKKYILNYFLGNLSIKRKIEIDRIAKENNCHVINILDKSDPFYDCGPSEFLYLEKNAFLICTDSFHSSVFAIIYDRPFIVFDREENGMNNMGSRIDTLLKKFKLKNRKFNGKNITEENFKHDYTEAYKILEKERKKSKDFLEKALNIKDSD